MRLCGLSRGVYGLLPSGATRRHIDATPDCPPSALVTSRDYPKIIDPKGVGYRRTARAARGHPH